MLITQCPSQTVQPSPAESIAATVRSNAAETSRDELERTYLNTCQRIEELLERKKRLAEEPNDVSALHQELVLLGSRIQNKAADPGQDDDYLAVIRRAKECLWRKLESTQVRGEFQALHFELLGLGQRLGYAETPPAASSRSGGLIAKRATPIAVAASAADPVDIEDLDSAEAGLDAVERQIAELQNRILGLQRH
jgi:hypothetical protein